MKAIIRIQPNEMRQVFNNIFLRLKMNEVDAGLCARIFTENSIDGIYTHGVYRIMRFIKYIRKGYIDVNAKMVREHAFNGLEQWNGKLAPGPVNGVTATGRAVELAEEYGIGCVALANTNHWMRGGAYGRLAAERGCFLLAWTNTAPNMPAWGAQDCRLGNNPFVLAAPAEPHPAVLDMAMTQYAWGTLEHTAQIGEKLSHSAGFDTDGNLTNDPSEVLMSMRPLSMGLWKGAGFSLLLDIAAAILSGGRSTKDFRDLPAEFGVSQVYIAISTRHLKNYPSIQTAMDQIMQDYYQSVPARNTEGMTDTPEILAPGDRVLRTRAENQKHGIPVLKSEWEKILAC